MAQIEVNSFFTQGGQPAINIDNNNPINGKNYPIIRIWEVTGLTYTLIVGDTIGTGQNFDGTMSPVADTGVEDGFYSFLFTDTIGYDETKKYLIRSDAGPSIQPAERYQVAQIDSNQIDATAIADAIWDEPAADHLGVGSMGLLQNQTKANTDQLFLDVAAIQVIVDLIRKYDTNRTKIDPTAKTLTVYDDDCVTPLRVFNLFDSTGAGSVSEVCERKSSTASDGQPVCP
jgi:hypothetical protein